MVDEISVFSYFKDTIWNQFTTANFDSENTFRVCLVISKIQSGTNSQRNAPVVDKCQKCV